MHYETTTRLPCHRSAVVDRLSWLQISPWCYKVFKQYMWQKGRYITFGGHRISTRQVGELHLMGLAQEYNLYGALKGVLTWYG